MVIINIASAHILLLSIFYSMDKKHSSNVDSNVSKKVHIIKVMRECREVNSTKVYISIKFHVSL